MRFLSEAGIGYRDRGRTGADRPGRDSLRPHRSAGAPMCVRTRRAATRPRRRATSAVEEGSVGAGAGATVGKMLGGGRAMKGGIGTASRDHDRWADRRRDRRGERRRFGHRSADRTRRRRRAHGRWHAASRIRLPSCCAASLPPAAGAREHDDRRRRHQRAADQGAGAEGRRDGARRPGPRDCARRTRPRMATRCSRWPPDGSNATANVGTIGALAAEVVSHAILRAVRAARGLPGYPAVADIR